MRTLSLNGLWKMHAVDEETLHDVTVPGSVYSAYLADGTMEDPFWRENELEAYDLLKKDFEFKRHFNLSAEELLSPRIFLKCDGLDTLAHVFLNGQEVVFS